MARPLAELAAGMLSAPAGLMVSDVTLDSRAVTPGALFLACAGKKHHGIEFAPQAIERGARAVLFEVDDAKSTLTGSAEARAAQSAAAQTGSARSAAARAAADAPGVFFGAVPRLSAHVGTIADRFFGSPSHALTIAGITGTNGKTTCAFRVGAGADPLWSPFGIRGHHWIRLAFEACRHHAYHVGRSHRAPTARPAAPNSAPNAWEWK